MDRGGWRRGEEGEDGVLVGPGREGVRSRGRQPRDFVAVVCVSSKINRGTIRRTTTRGHRRRIEFHGNELARIVFVAHVVVVDPAVGPRVIHIPADLHRCQRKTKMRTARRRRRQRVDGRRRGAEGGGGLLGDAKSIQYNDIT